MVAGEKEPSCQSRSGRCYQDLQWKKEGGTTESRIWSMVVDKVVSDAML